ncbi:SDR family NAD(P)-dependent oxidoreductase [Pacificimonas sp. ICDLI1SI03]
MLRDKTILVIGSTSGIGRAAYELCASHGARVIGIGRSQEAGESIARSCGGRFIPLDITDEDAVVRLFEYLAQENIKLDGAINNAAMTHDAAPIDRQDLSLFDQVFSINVRSLFHCLQHEISAMRKDGGSIVNISSIAGRRGFAGLSIYSASKHAVIGLTRSAALDCAADNVRVNSVCPGTTRTEMFERQMKTRPGGAEATIKGIPMGRISEPTEPAAAAVWLLSDQASFVTGETLTIDGGRTIA